MTNLSTTWLRKNARARWIKLVGALALFAIPALVDARLAGTGSPEVAFVAVGPAGLKIKGTTHDLALADDGQTLTVTVKLAQLTTGIGLRDRHMREKYLQVQIHPTAELKVARAAVRAPTGGEQVQQSAQGDLQLHGTTKASPFRYTAHRVGNDTVVDGMLSLDMRAFGIEVPSYMGVTVKPNVDVQVQFKVVDR